MMHKRMVYEGGISHWACISLSRYVTVAMAPQLCNELLEICLTSGVVFERNPVLTVRSAEPAAMGVFSYTSNVISGGQQADPDCLGFGSCGRTEVVQRPREISFHKQKEDRPFPREETVILNQNEYEEISKVDEHATLNHRIGTDEATETPFGRFGVLLWEAMQASTLTLLAISKEGSGRQMTGACRTNQPMDPRVGQSNDSGLWAKGGCWIYFVQDANRHMWERSCRDLRIHHVQPD
jgi:hypothetical protein